MHVYFIGGGAWGWGVLQAALAAFGLQPSFPLQLNGNFQRDERSYTDAHSLTHGYEENCLKFGVFGD